MALSPATSPGAIVHGGWSYRLRADDLLWAARMVEGETVRGRARQLDDALAVLWTMTALFTPAAQRDKYGRVRFEALSDLLRAYSQPINPRWRRDGEFCRPGGRYHGADACAPARLDARERLQRTPWEALEPELRAVVLRWATGKTRNPVPKAVEFAAPRVAAAHIARNPGAQSVATLQNQFVASARSARWTSLPTVIAGAAEERAATSLLGVALGAAALGALVGWGLSRQQKKRRR